MSRQRNDTEMGATECPWCAKLMHLTHDGRCDNCGKFQEPLADHDTMVAIARKWADGDVPELRNEYPA